MAKESMRISFMIDPDKRDSLDKIACAYGKNLSAIINEAINQYIDIHGRHANIAQIEADATEDGDFATD
ncbi:MAG TPA: ribbon-helix-helix protein, CopG family [Thermodesulfobacteriota bacterium]|nr:ribbon-helix-helix protein, CopG family [Thermodesulfobacteriota bacterium]